MNEMWFFQFSNSIQFNYENTDKESIKLLESIKSIISQIIKKIKMNNVKLRYLGLVPRSLFLNQQAQMGFSFLIFDTRTYYII